MGREDDAALRARLHEELGFYPAALDEASIAEYRRWGRRRGQPARRSEVTVQQDDQDEIEARKKKAERGWIVPPPKPNPGIGPVEEIERWYAVIGVRGSAA